MATAFSISLVTTQALVLANGRPSWISTRSAAFASLFSLCAWYLLERTMILSYIGCLTRRSIRTVTVLSILSLTTRPISVRLLVVSLIVVPPFHEEGYACARYRGALCRSGCGCSIAGWQSACADRIVPSADPAAPYLTRRRFWL